MASTKRVLSRTSVTMRDVAKLANVSQSTVSRVLSGAAEPIPIGEETRQRVLDAVQQLGYQPNLHAGSLRGQKTQMIAMMIADIANPFYHPMVRAVQDVANAHRYDFMIANSDHTAVGERHFLESVIRRPVDGVIVVPYFLTDDDLDELIGRTGAVVGAVGQHLRHPLVDIAYGDDRQATIDVITWLHAERAHVRIGFIGTPDRVSAAARRRQAFEQAMHNAGLATPAAYVQEGDWSIESGYAAMKRLLALPAPPTAVFACNDMMAIGALDAVQHSGLRVPEDVAIVGFDDIPATSWVRPHLSTVAQYPGEMGVLLAKALFERIQGEYSGPGRRFEVPCRFVKRDSA
jgi:LacI family transcriptional regulator